MSSGVSASTFARASSSSSANALALRKRVLTQFQIRTEKDAANATVNVLNQSLEAQRIRKPDARSLMQILNIQA
ncbi:MAG: hypothetical protein INF16_00205 [Methylobacterium sp.]|jgi:hypothetical protein|nr:hypothetical protein [Methylobacterium sp.]MCE2932760.1 hypothetical protein [Hyphomicrobiales bacterium]MCZ8270920.1 hypothetical protein [Beijerinckiaceae bacterium]MCA3635384.1 hypothetical protein [Methylobacterium sp.]MCA3637948.1 hypothetical protein [Methylobacterium sp.]